MRTFSRLTLADLKLGLDDLAQKRHAALVLSAIGGAYEPSIMAKRDAINALPAVLTSNKPLAEELAEADATHDGFGAAIYFFTEAYQRVPDLDPKLAEAIRRIRAASITRLDQLQDSYADESAAAADRKEQLAATPELVADLNLFPIAGGISLLGWMTQHLDAGVRLGELLSGRADLDTGARAAAGTLRSQTVGLLNRARAAIADDVAQNEKLPRDLDGQIFGYLDELEDRREAAARAAKAASKKAEAKKAEEAKPANAPEAPKPPAAPEK